METYIISAYDMYGNQFGITIEAKNTEEMFRIFHEECPECDVADYILILEQK